MIPNQSYYESTFLDKLEKSIKEAATTLMHSQSIVNILDKQ